MAHTMINGWQITEFKSVEEIAQTAPRTAELMIENGWNGMANIRRPRGRVQYIANVNTETGHLAKLGRI